MVGSYCRGAFQKRTVQIYENDTLPERIDLLVMGGFTVKYIHKFIEIIRGHRIETVVLPYLAPIQRLVLTEENKESGVKAREVTRFLQDPYQFLKEYDIGNIYFLYGNGKIIDRKPEELEWGYHFELADRESLLLIREMEGYSIPVARAGYIVENDWLFYFGVYGTNIQMMSEFAKNYFSNIENIYKISENINEDYVRQTKRLVQEYYKKFGGSSVMAIAMFEGHIQVKLTVSLLRRNFVKVNRVKFGCDAIKRIAVHARLAVFMEKIMTICSIIKEAEKNRDSVC